MQGRARKMEEVEMAIGIRLDGDDVRFVRGLERAERDRCEEEEFARIAKSDGLSFMDFLVGWACVSLVAMAIVALTSQVAGCG